MEEQLIKRTEAVNRVEEYERQLKNCGLSTGTIYQYLLAVRQWLATLPEEIDAVSMSEYRDYLTEHYAPNSINAKLTAVNRYLKFLDCEHLTLRTEHIQQGSGIDKLLSFSDYEKMLGYAVMKKDKTYHIMRTIALTGIRVSELKYITVEAIETGVASVFNKGKHRKVYLPDRLCKELQGYCTNRGIDKGIVFSGKTAGKPISPAGVWSDLKYVAVKAGVPEELAYPHNLRHLFARAYMKQIGDLTELADLLGHSSLETTRIYTRTTTEEKRDRLNRIEL